MTKPIEQLFADFLSQLREKNRIKLVPFDEQRWFRGAYSTIQRTLRDEFKPLTEDSKVSCASVLFKDIPKLKGNVFDQNLKDLILKTAKDFNVSIGHAQKLISVLTKYAAACHHHSDSQVPDDWKKLVQSKLGRFPVPVDAIVLYRLKQHYPDQFSDVIAGSGQDKKGRQTFWAKVVKNGVSQTWSRISDYETYWSLQKRIRALAKANKVAPLEFEMRCLWVAE